MKTIDDFIIETPLAEVFIDGISQGFHNEFTCRNLQLAVKNGKLKNVKIIFDKKTSVVEKDGVLMPNFLPGFYDISYKLALNMMD